MSCCLNVLIVKKFAPKCSYQNSSDGNEVHNMKKDNKHHQHKRDYKWGQNEEKKSFHKHKKRLYSKEESSSSKEFLQ